MADKPVEDLPGDFEDDGGEGLALNPDDILEVVEVDEDQNFNDDESEYGEIEDDIEEVEDVEGEGEGEGEGGMIKDYGDNSSKRVVLHEQDKSIFCLDASTTKGLVATGGEDDVAYIWKISDGSVLFKSEHEDSVLDVQFNKDSSMVATASMDGVINVCNTETGEIIVKLDCGDDLEWIDWHPKANFIIAGTQSGSVYMWDVPGANMSFFSGHGARVTAGKWSPDGRSFVTVAEDGVAIVWSPKNRSIQLKLDAKSNHLFNMDGISCVAYHSDGVLAAFGGRDGKVLVVQTKTGKVVASVEGHTDSIEALAFSPAMHNLLATASLDGTVRVVDVVTELVECVCQHEGGVVAVEWHPTQPIVFSSSLDATVRSWNGRSGEPIHLCAGHKDHVLGFKVFNEGNSIVTCSEDGSSLIFDNVIEKNTDQQEPNNEQ